MQHHAEILEYFNTRGVSVIFLFRRNLLRRMISVLANLYDRDAKPLNGIHKSHVHSPDEVSLSLSQGFWTSIFFLLQKRTLVVVSYVEFLYLLREMVSGRDSCKVQAQNQCYIVDSQSEASRRDYCQSFGVLQEQPAHHPILWRCSKKPHCKFNWLEYSFWGGLMAYTYKTFMYSSP